jgi:hypothetical protein
MAGQVREWKSALGRGKNKSFWFYVFFTFHSQFFESMAPTIYAFGFALTVVLILVVCHR